MDRPASLRTRPRDADPSRLGARQAAPGAPWGGAGGARLVLPPLPRREGRKVGGVVPRAARPSSPGRREETGEGSRRALPGARVGQDLQGRGGERDPAAHLDVFHLPEDDPRCPLPLADRSDSLLDCAAKTCLLYT